MATLLYFAGAAFFEIPLHNNEHLHGPKSRSGDFSFVFRLLGGRSTTFAVPKAKCDDILVLFNFDWEGRNRGSPSLCCRDFLAARFACDLTDER
jgi:hypothetical protein